MPGFEENDFFYHSAVNGYRDTAIIYFNDENFRAALDFYIRAFNSSEQISHKCTKDYVLDILLQIDIRDCHMELAYLEKNDEMQLKHRQEAAIAQEKALTLHQQKLSNRLPNGMVTTDEVVILDYYEHKTSKESYLNSAAFHKKKKTVEDFVQIDRLADDMEGIEVAPYKQPNPSGAVWQLGMFGATKPQSDFDLIFQKMQTIGVTEPRSNDLNTWLAPPTFIRA